MKLKNGEYRKKGNLGNSFEIMIKMVVMFQNLKKDLIKYSSRRDENQIIKMMIMC